MDQALQLVDEIKQITDQYKAEVSTKRRAWPNSIKERVSELRSLGHSCGSISKMTGIPEPTVWLWTSKKALSRACRKKAEFLPVEVNSTVKPLTVKSELSPLTVKGYNSLIVELPGGIKIEGLDLDSIVELSRRLTQ